MKNLIDGGYTVVIATPIVTVPDIVRQCVEKKVAGAIVISAGGKVMSIYF